MISGEGGKGFMCHPSLPTGPLSNLVSFWISSEDGDGWHSIVSDRGEVSLEAVRVWIGNSGLQLNHGKIEWL